MSQSKSVKKQRTIDLGEQQVWGKLAPLTPGLSTYQMKESIIIIGRNPECQIQINDKRLSGKHCRLQKKEDQITLIDLSTNGTYVRDTKIGKGNGAILENEDEIWLLPAARVKPTETLGFKLQLLNCKKKEQQNPRKTEEIEKKDAEQSNDNNQKKQTKEQDKQQKKQKDQNQSKIDLFAQSIKDQITCSFCFQIMHQPVSVQPCNHRFCGGCLTQLVNNKKGDCIQCRKKLTTGVKDSSFNSIIDDYLKSHPEEKRDPKQLETMSKKNIFGFDPLDIVYAMTGKVPKKTALKKQPRGSGRRAASIVRASSDLSASDQDEARCRQCMTARDGFQCGRSQKHVPCLNCRKLIADRDDPALNQKCILCSQFYCNLYYPPCRKNGIQLKLTKDRKGQNRIDPEVLRSNRHEFEIIRDYLSAKKMTSREMFDIVLAKMEKNQFSYIIDRKIMRIAPLVPRQVKLKPNDAICDTCWKDVWFQMVFYYRSSINEDLPPAIRKRPICYWGINCRTMDHNVDHAQKYNHILYQTRF